MNNAPLGRGIYRRERLTVNETATPPQLRTPGVMASELGVALHRVLHILSTRSHIRPRARAGTLRLYGDDAVAMVRHELNSIEARRGKGGSNV